MKHLTKQILLQIAPRFHGHKRQSQLRIIDAISVRINQSLSIYGIITALREAHFLAQICHESDGFATLEEYASGKAYEGRVKDLGNTQPGDGVRYKGRGLIQLTGRTNYRDIGQKLGVDLENNPQLAADPKIAVLTACEYWKRHHLNHLADNDDLRHITRIINGGYNGLAQRRHYLQRAKLALTSLEPLPPIPSGQIETMIA